MNDRPEGGERVVIVHLQLRDAEQTSDPIEFRELALSAGAAIVGTLTCARDVPDAKYCLGSGKVEELRLLVQAEKAELVLIDHPLSPAQERNLEKTLKCRVCDRTRLILDIFAVRARSYEGKLQVELAQLKHLASRLVRGWTHLERQKGGIGLRGPGETQLEVDRRIIRSKIKYIEARLDKVRKTRAQGRQARTRAALPTVSLVGYTNSGKSTLFNALTGADTFVANQLFATLDPTLRSMVFPYIGKVILADTVGFVRQLPHDLVEAFRATLEETQDAELLLHVIDANSDLNRAHIQQVEVVLTEIGALAVPRIEVYNKIDLLPDIEPHYERDQNGRIVRIFVSATKKLGLDLLKKAMSEHLEKEIVSGEVSLPIEAGRARAKLFEAGVVEQETLMESGGWILTIRMPASKWQKFCMKEPILGTCFKATSR